MAQAKDLSDFKVLSVLWKKKTHSSEIDMLNGKKKSPMHKQSLIKKELLKTSADKLLHLPLKSQLSDLNPQLASMSVLMFKNMKSKSELSIRVSKNWNLNSELNELTSKDNLGQKIP